MPGPCFGPNSDFGGVITNSGTSDQHKHKQTKSDLTKKPQSQDAPKGPLQIIISIADQRISLYENGALIARSSVSTGVERHPTPLGVFSVSVRKNGIAQTFIALRPCLTCSASPGRV